MRRLLTTDAVAAAFEKSVEVAFQAVRKPVEGTILTVLRDSASAAVEASKLKLDTEAALETIVSAAYDSVQRTPELLPVLKENGVVDAGGFGLAILFDAFVSALLGKEGTLGDELAFARTAAPKVEIEQINDWEGSAFRYCNEFLVDSDVLDPAEALEFLATMGDCELCVGSVPKFKVHVHSNHPDQVLAYFLERGQISEVFIHNMQLQSEERTEKLAAEQAAERKPIGFVAVAAGVGQRRDPQEPRRRRGGFGRSDHESLHEGPSRRHDRGQRGRGHRDAEQLQHHHGCAERVRTCRLPLRRGSHQEHASGVRRHVRRRSGGEP